MRFNITTVLLGMVCSSVLLSADMVYKLEQKNGHTVPYTLAEDEVAILHGSHTVHATGKFKKNTPSYSLLSVDGKMMSNSQTAMDTQQNKPGQVFYKYGQKEDGYRYVTTASVLITFDKNSTVNIENFAKENSLKVVKTVMSNKQKEIVLFRNLSNKNDVELSSYLNKTSKNISVKPNWILPIKLF